jgi:hypothetical protein
MRDASSLKHLPIDSLDAYQLVALQIEALEDRDWDLARRCLDRLRQLARSPHLDRQHTRQWLKTVPREHDATGDDGSVTTRRGRARKASTAASEETNP